MRTHVASPTVLLVASALLCAACNQSSPPGASLDGAAFRGNHDANGTGVVMVPGGGDGAPAREAGAPEAAPAVDSSAAIDSAAPRLDARQGAGDAAICTGRNCCTSTNDCGRDNLNACDLTTHQCVQCLVNTDCDGNNLCRPDHTCAN
jgi:hypothetical protein